MIVSMVNVMDLKAGDKVKPLAAPGLTDEDLTGLVDRHGLGVFTRFSSTMTDDNGRLMIYVSFDGTEILLSSWELAECADATPTEQRDNEIERLKQRIKELEDTTTGQLLRIGDLKKALQIVNDRLNQEAIDRNWCGTYVEILDEVNRKIRDEAGGCFTLEGNEQDFEVEVTGSSYVNWSKVVSVRATSEEEACRLVDNDLSSYLDEDEAAQEEVDSGGWNSHEIDEISIYS